MTRFLGIKEAGDIKRSPSQTDSVIFSHDRSKQVLMNVALLTTDNREHFHDYSTSKPYFGRAPEALLQGLTRQSEVNVHVFSCARQPMSSPERLAEHIYFHSLHVSKIGWLRTGYQGCIRAVRTKLQELR